MNCAREDERRTRLADADRVASEKRERATRIEAAKLELYALFGAAITAQDRGRKLESALNNVFQAYGVLVRQAFHLVGEAGEGIVEQIDGVIELGADLYFWVSPDFTDTLLKPSSVFRTLPG
jgi:hypothetical protein